MLDLDKKKYTEQYKWLIFYAQISAVITTIARAEYLRIIQRASKHINQQKERGSFSLLIESCEWYVLRDVRIYRISARVPKVVRIKSDNLIQAIWLVDLQSGIRIFLSPFSHQPPFHPTPISLILSRMPNAIVFIVSKNILQGKKSYSKYTEWSSLFLTFNDRFSTWNLRFKAHLFFSNLLILKLIEFFLIKKNQFHIR